MASDNDKEIIELMREARERARGYADFFGWATDRDLEEWGVITYLAESLRAEDKLFFNGIKMRGRSNDPPDCEALNQHNQRLAIEITELVDGEAIQAYKNGAIHKKAHWDNGSFIEALNALVLRKDARFTDLKAPPYPGGYMVVVFTDEPALDMVTVQNYLTGHRLQQPRYVNRAFLLLSYDTGIQRCPFFELQFQR